MWSKWRAPSLSASGLRTNDRPSPIASTWSLFMGVIVRLADFVAAAGAISPVFPGPPGFRHVRLVARGACGDLALRQRLRLAAHAHGVHLHPGIARQIDRQPHHLDDRARRRGEAVAAHQRDAALAHALRQVAALRYVSY